MCRSAPTPLAPPAPPTHATAVVHLRRLLPLLHANLPLPLLLLLLLCHLPLPQHQLSQQLLLKAGVLAACTALHPPLTTPLQPSQWRVGRLLHIRLQHLLMLRLLRW